MTKSMINTLHRSIQEQFDIMHGLVEEINRLKDGDAEDKEQAKRLAKILTKLSEEAYRMNEVVREAA